MKTGAWLRGGRGKIAGMVAQKSSDGKGTVLRELVVPSNPQTIEQMAQRLAFGTVTQAASLMLPIIGQTFKGQPDEKMNRRRFVALNTPILRAEAISQRNGGTVKGSFRGKTSTALIPNNYIMSEGNLVLPVALLPTVSLTNPNMPSVGTPQFSHIQLEDSVSYSPANVIAQIIGMGVKQQLTVVAIGTVKGADIYNYKREGDDSAFVRESGFAACRINLNPNAPEFVFRDDMTAQEIQDALRPGFDAEKTTAAFISGFLQDASVEGPELIVDSGLTDILANEFFGSDYLVKALGCILSELVDGAWNYSNSSLVCVPPAGEKVLSNNWWYGMSFNNALVDYIGAEAASKLFTRKGGLINEI